MTHKLRSVEEVNTDFAFKASDFGLTGEQIVELYSIATQDRQSIVAVLIEGLEGIEYDRENSLISPLESHRHHDIEYGFKLAISKSQALIRTTLDVTSEEK